MKIQVQNRPLSVLFLILLLVSMNCTDTRDVGTNPPGDGAEGLTELKGSVEETLTLAASPYHVIDTLLVDTAKSLTIEPGVKLLFDDSTMLMVKGRITANGGSNEKVIRFGAFDSKWQGIKIINSPLTSIFAFCIIEDVEIEQNDPSDFGALEINESSVTVRNCIFRNNFSMHGGGISLLGDNALIANNIFRDNSAVAFGGAIVAVESSAKIINNTIYHNNSFNVGGGLVIFDPVNLEVQNNIFFENSAVTGDPRIEFASGDTTKYLQQYNFLWVGNMNPKFLSTEDLHLQNTSPCIDAGNPDPVYNDTDGSRNDQGAYGGPWGNW